MVMTWSVAQHDTIPAVELCLSPVEGHAYLLGFLNAAGQSFVPPYSAVREAVEDSIQLSAARKTPAQPPRSNVSDQRIRTWKSTFENFGFLQTNEAGILSLTPLGRTTKELYQQLNEKIEGANDHLAKLAIEVLSRHRLKNPVEAGNYPDDSDLHPMKAIWRAMRMLDNKIHWQEMNRVLLHLNYAREVEGAINHIREFRRLTGGNYSERIDELGPAAVDDGPETRRRITPWFTRAGFGGLLVTSEDDAAGFRQLNHRYLPLIDQALASTENVAPEVLTSPRAYIAYVTQVKEEHIVRLNADDEEAVAAIFHAVQKFGSKKVICLAGLPSTGKTRLSEMVASKLTDGDPYRLMEVQFHESTSYDEFVEGFVPKPSGEGFELVPKTLRVINRRAKLDPTGAQYVLLIEELTRANVHAVIGELLTYIEHRDRSFRLPLSQEEERIAPNLIVLATMNPRDKSAVLLDAAIQRRLHRVNIPPSAEALRSMLSVSLPDAERDALMAWYSKHLEVLPFGHGVFSDVTSVGDLSEVWNGTVVYLLSDALGHVQPVYESAAAEFPWK
jgi:hypothetical protein